MRLVEQATGKSVMDYLASKGISASNPFTDTNVVSAFDRMAKYYDRTAKTHAKAISTMTYPAFVILVAIVVVYVIMNKAVPAFINTFDDLGAELPPITVGLIAVSNFTTRYGKYVAAGILALIAALWLYSRTEKGGLLFSRLRLSLPEIGRAHV